MNQVTDRAVTVLPPHSPKQLHDSTQEASPPSRKDSPPHHLSNTTASTSLRAEQSSEALEIYQITNRDEFATIKEDWDCLCGARSQPSPFLDWEYLDLWWETHEKNPRIEVLIYLFRKKDSQTIVGAAPLMIGYSKHLPRSFRYLGFLGTYGEILSEYEDFLIPEEKWRAPALNLLASEIASSPLRKKWDVLALSYVPEDSPHIDLLAEFLDQDHGIHLRKVSEQKSYTIELRDSHEEWVAGRSKKFRKHLRALDRKIQAEESYQLQIGSSVCSPEEFMDEFQRLCELRWGDDGADCQSDIFREFHTALMHRWRESGQVLLTLLRIDDKVFSVEYGFVYGNKQWAYQGTWDPDHKNLSPAWLSQNEVVRHCIDHNLKEFDFLPGEESFKAKWSTSHLVASFYEGTNAKTLRGNLFALLRTAMSCRRMVLNLLKRP